MTSFVDRPGTAYYPPSGPGGGSDDNWQYQVFVIPSDTTTPQTFNLIAFPHVLSPVVTLNGLVLREGDDYSVNYGAGTFTVFDNMFTNDVLTIRYEWSTVVDGGSVVAITAPTTPFNAHVGGTDSGASGIITRTFTPGSCAQMYIVVGWATGGNDNAFASTISDTAGHVWSKVCEVIEDNPANPSTVGLAIFTAKAEHTPGATTISVTTPPHAAFDVVDIEFADTIPTFNAGVTSGLNVTSVTPTLPLKPASTDGTFTAFVCWPHKVVTIDPTYTDFLNEENPGGSGPYFQTFRFDVAYNITSPGQSATLTIPTGSDTVAAIVSVTPTIPC